MRNRTRRQAVIFVTCVLTACGTLLPNVNAAFISNSFAKYGRIMNVGPFGVCAATAVMNSFIFLDNMYPGVYGATPLKPTNMSDDTALAAFAIAGWDRPDGSHHEGYYTHFYDTSNKDNPDEGLMTWKQDWVHDFHRVQPDSNR